MMQRMTRWSEARASAEVANTFVLSGATRAVPIYPLQDDRCPVLKLSQHLLSVGWSTEQRLVRHDNPEGRVFDSRGGTRTRWYLHCLARGLDKCLFLSIGGTIPSQEPMSYYRLLLSGVRCTPGRKAAEYTLALNEHRRRRGEDLVVAGPGEDPPIPVPGPSAGGIILLPREGDDLVPAPSRRGGGAGSLRARPAQGRGRGKSGEQGIIPPILLPPEPSPPPDPLPAPAPPPLPAPAGILLLPPEEVGDAPVATGKKKDPNIWIDGLDGSKVCFKAYLHTDATEPYSNYKITCPCKDHARGVCMKTRGAQFTHTHGDIEVLAFLHAWREMEFPAPGCKRTHALTDPPAEAVARWVRDRGAELRVLLLSIQDA